MALVLTVLASPASAAVSIKKQSCSMSSSTCVDQSVDNNDEKCIVVTKNASHHANWCIYSHGWSHVLDVYVDGRVETCVGYQACIGVDHFQWVNSQIVLWALSGGHYYGIESGSDDIPSYGTTGPTDTLYSTHDYNYSGIHDCQKGTSSGVVTHTEADIKVFWSDGTNTAAVIENSGNHCHNQ